MKTVICCCHEHKEGHAIGTAEDPKSAEMLALISCDKLTMNAANHGGHMLVQEGDDTYKIGFDEKDDWNLVAQWIL